MIGCVPFRIDGDEKYLEFSGLGAELLQEVREHEKRCRTDVRAVGEPEEDDEWLPLQVAARNPPPIRGCHLIQGRERDPAWSRMLRQGGRRGAKQHPHQGERQQTRVHCLPPDSQEALRTPLRR